MQREIGQRDENNLYFYFLLISISFFPINFYVILNYHTLGDKCWQLLCCLLKAREIANHTCTWNVHC